MAQTKVLAESVLQGQYPLGADHIIGSIFIQLYNTWRILSISIMFWAPLEQQNIATKKHKWGNNLVIILSIGFLHSHVRSLHPYHSQL